MTTVNLCVIERDRTAKCNVMHYTGAAYFFANAKFEDATFADVVDTINHSKYPARWSECRHKTQKGYKLLTKSPNEFEPELTPSIDNLSRANLQQFVYDATLILDLDKKRRIHIDDGSPYGDDYGTWSREDFWYNQCDKAHPDRHPIYRNRDPRFEGYNLGIKDPEQRKEASDENRQKFIDALLACKSPELRLPQRVSDCLTELAVVLSHPTSDPLAR